MFTYAFNDGGVRLILPDKRGQADALQAESTTKMATTQNKYGRRFAEKFKREVTALASKPSAMQERLPVVWRESPYIVGRWEQPHASDAYHELRRCHGSIASMGRVGNVDDNARMATHPWTLHTV